MLRHTHTSEVPTLLPQREPFSRVSTPQGKLKHHRHRPHLQSCFTLAIDMYLLIPENFRVPDALRISPFHRSQVHLLTSQQWILLQTVLRMRANGPITVDDERLRGGDIPGKLLALSETRPAKPEAISAFLVTRVHAVFSSEVACMRAVQDLQRCFPNSLPLKVWEQWVKPRHQAVPDEPDCSCILAQWSADFAWYSGRNVCPRHASLVSKHLF